MTDPVSLGGFVATVLAIGADAALKVGIGEAVKDAYRGLKGLLSPLAASEVEALEKAPASKGKQLAVAEIIDGQTDDNARRKIKELALALSEALQAAEKKSPIGINIKDLETAYLDIKNMVVESGQGIVVEKANIPGGVTIESLTVGKTTR